METVLRYVCRSDTDLPVTLHQHHSKPPPFLYINDSQLLPSSASFISPVILTYTFQPSPRVNRWIQEGTNEVQANQLFPQSMLTWAESHLTTVPLDPSKGIASCQRPFLY